MSVKKGYIRTSQAPSVEDLEKTAAQLNTNTAATPPPPTQTVMSTTAPTVRETVYSYTIKLDDDLEKRVEAATKKYRQTKKGFFLSAIEDRLEKLGC